MVAYRDGYLPQTTIVLFIIIMMLFNVALITVSIDMLT